MNVVDPSGWLAYFADGQNATRFAATREHDATLWTQDRDVEGLGEVKYFPKK
jgi:hypothetical protein